MAIVEIIVLFDRYTIPFAWANDVEFKVCDMPLSAQYF
jgi:hypothetical protein